MALGFSLSHLLETELSLQDGEPLSSMKKIIIAFAVLLVNKIKQIIILTGN